MTTNAIEIFRQTTRRIADKVTQFEKLLRDPDLAPYVSALKNGVLPQLATASAPAKPSAKVAPATKPVAKAAPVPAPAKRSAVKTGSPSGLRDAIRSLKGQLPREFTAGHVTQELQRKKFPIGGKRPEKTIQNTLFKLSEKREVKRIKSGSGGQTNTYIWTGKR